MTVAAATSTSASKVDSLLQDILFFGLCIVRYIPVVIYIAVLQQSYSIEQLSLLHSIGHSDRRKAHAVEFAV